jgi:hypothetical protein
VADTSDLTWVRAELHARFICRNEEIEDLVTRDICFREKKNTFPAGDIEEYLLVVTPTAVSESECRPPILLRASLASFSKWRTQNGHIRHLACLLWLSSRTKRGLRHGAPRRTSNTFRLCADQISFSPWRQRGHISSDSLRRKMAAFISAKLILKNIPTLVYLRRKERKSQPRLYKAWSLMALWPLERFMLLR